MPRTTHRPTWKAFEMETWVVSSWSSQWVVVLLASVRAGSACRCRRFLDAKLHINNKIFVSVRHRHDGWKMDAQTWSGEG
jgi:hypothetical protein